jgi:hypothetical protein
MSTTINPGAAGATAKPVALGPQGRLSPGGR